MINEQRRGSSGADAEINLYNVLPILAATYGRLGKFDQAFDALEQWLGVRQKHSSSSVDKFYYRIRGELLLRTGDLEEADKNLRKAMQLGAREGAKTEELRSVTALARLLRDTDRRDEARAMLSDIYNWFTEGFDTADLKDAKALLYELSAQPA